MIDKTQERGDVRGGGGGWGGREEEHTWEDHLCGFLTQEPSNLASALSPCVAPLSCLLQYIRCHLRLKQTYSVPSTSPVPSFYGFSLPFPLKTRRFWAFKRRDRPAAFGQRPPRPARPPPCAARPPPSGAQFLTALRPAPRTPGWGVALGRPWGPAGRQQRDGPEPRRRGDCGRRFPRFPGPASKPRREPRVVTAEMTVSLLRDIQRMRLPSTEPHAPAWNPPGSFPCPAGHRTPSTVSLSGICFLVFSGGHGADVAAAGEVEACSGCSPRVLPSSVVANSHFVPPCSVSGNSRVSLSRGTGPPPGWCRSRTGAPIRRAVEVLAPTSFHRVHLMPSSHRRDTLEQSRKQQQSGTRPQSPGSAGRLTKQAAEVGIREILRPGTPMQTGSLKFMKCLGEGKVKAKEGWDLGKASSKAATWLPVDGDCLLLGRMYMTVCWARQTLRDLPSTRCSGWSVHAIGQDSRYSSFWLKGNLSVLWVPLWTDSANPAPRRYHHHHPFHADWCQK
ncbi:hypothetical protein Cadr_000014298 [Camelus dromedarius]|uniref:Uncharacterized protein n=1 Tax=Camelus dromedarius TaxID=9838 RepID=A0A5N4DP46_CAMDR|nr:hypothetical protein Cadr_000014298 [Camelus dromedarius]